MMLARSLAGAPRRTALAGGRGLPAAGATQRNALANAVRRAYSDDVMSAPRESMDYDVVIVGAGPAGLAASIRIKQLAAETGKELSVCVVEKGAEVGAHILSGNVFEPRGLSELIPNWRDLDAPVSAAAGLPSAS